MRPIPWIFCLGALCGFTYTAWAADAASQPDVSAKTSPSAASLQSPSAPASGQTEVTADQSLEWYQDQHLYVARGHAKAVKGGMTVEADVLTAHEREQPMGPDGKPIRAPKPQKNASGDNSNNGTSDIDRMTAEGNVVITTEKGHAYGDHGLYDTDKHVAYLTGQHLLYKTTDETVTARDSLEYWEDRKVAVARGNAIAIKGDKHVEGDVLTAQFRDMPNGKSEMQTLTADGHVTIITKGDIVKGDRSVYDVSRNIAVISGNVHITRADGTQLNGDVAEMDFATNQSRLLNEGPHTRVRVLLGSKSSSKASQAPAKSPATPAASNAAATSSSTQGSP